MVIGINNRNEIKQVKNITDSSLTVIDLDETALDYPFNGWSETKILCYCYESSDKGVSIYPYIDSNIIEKIELSDKETSKNRADIDFIAIMTDIDLEV